jgi:hypothetical protein
MSSSHLAIAAAEKPRLRQVMKDIQETTAAYYAETARGGDLGAHVRNWLTRVQNLNDLLTEQVGDKATYKALFGTTPAAGAELINAVKYARNVDQHLMHIVAPSEDNLIGGTQGLRVYAFWEPIPPATHHRLRPRTQALQAAYQAKLEGKEVTATMLAVLRFFACLAPQIIHRDHRDEWTGFPLMNQPGVLAPLHPEEPVDDVAAANAWLNSRRPNGDLRVVAGQVTQGDTNYLVGFTFADQLSFTPFVETPTQVEQDIAAGFSYLMGDLAANVAQVQEKFPRAQGGVFHSPTDVTTWASHITQTKWDEDWTSMLDRDWWEHAVRLEHDGLFPDFVAYEHRRARRLNAAVPPR